MKIELQNIKPTYMSESEILGSDIYLCDNVVFEEGKKYLIKANSGQGKTSVLNFIYGSNFNFEGKINYIPNSEGVFDLRKKSLSYVFQDFKLFSNLSVLENIQLKNKLTNFKTQDEIDILIEKVGLNHKKNTLLKTLSLGQKQRVAILRALCQPFKFLLLDEPFSHLDSKNIKLLSEIINTEIEQQNSSLIIASLENEYFFEYDKIFKL